MEHDVKGILAEAKYTLIKATALLIGVVGTAIGIALFIGLVRSIFLFIF